MDESAFARFIVKVNVTPDGCWLWTGARTKQGYANFTLDARRGSYVFRVGHRVSYEHYVGPIPEGLQLDHLCRVRHCVNPEHVELVTAKENSQRGARGRLVRICKHGHHYTPENTIVRKNGRRLCRECARLSSVVQNEKSRLLGTRGYALRSP